MNDFLKLFLLFVIYAIVGWLWETVYCSLKARKFVYRGFLMGPYCPIYGFGILGVLYFVEPYQENVFLLFVYSAILVSLVEFLTSYLLEKLFQATWWDYHHLPFNLQGRVALSISLFWGLGCVIIVKFVHPKILLLLSYLWRTFGQGLPVLLLFILTIDLIYTVSSMVSFKEKLTAWSEALNQSQEKFSFKKKQLKEDYNEGVARLRIQLNQRELPGFNLTHRRILKNFNRFKMSNINNMSELREIIKKLKKIK